jgi:predicted ATPase/class 3 adenylate cyclase/DNA-binding CsgD family transcriptional regulator
MNDEAAVDPDAAAPAPGRTSLPTGTVTFLLTDVESSTRLWAERGPEMSMAIPRHYSILDDAIAAHGGRRPMEQGEGDSVVAVFEEAGDAVAAAVEAQRVLVDELPWLRVRMAIHTGTAQLRDDQNYVGTTIIRCARLRAAAHGGQVLVSEATAALLDPAEALTRLGVHLDDLGVVRLRDLTRAERVWQVWHPELPADFPPLRSLASPPHNVPAALTSLVGRDDDLEAVAKLLTTSRLVTLAGAGGCGKTRLAQHVAAALLENHPGGTWWIELAQLSGGEQIGERMVVALGVAVPATVDPLEVVARHLGADAPALVLLDNAEHLIDDVAAVAERLLVTCPQLRVVVTSREPLGTASETVWRVPSLAVPDRREVATLDSLDSSPAARLFLERARAARPNLVLDATGAAAVAAICQRLDGIPLALELAAARARSLPLDRLAAGLDDAFRLLTGGSRTALARQQTLLASIAWSVELLTAEERAVFRRLAVFRSAFTLDAAEQVAADGDLVDSYDVLDRIGKLVDKSLVQFDDQTGRYHLLETIRQFGFDSLQREGELASVRARHAAYFASWCEAITTRPEGLTTGPSCPELPDVFSAFDWASEVAPREAYRITTGLGWVRAAIGHYVEFERQWEFVTSREGLDDPAEWAVGAAGLSLGALTTARTEYVAMLPRIVARLDPDDTAHRRLASAWPVMAETMSTLHGSPAMAAADEAVAADDDHAVRFLCGAAAFAGLFAGDPDEADRRAGQVRQMLARHGLPFQTATAHQGFAWGLGSMIERGRLSEVRELLRSNDLATGASRALTLGMAAYLAAATGDRELLRRANDFHLDDFPNISRSLAVMARVFLADEMGEPDPPGKVMLLFRAQGFGLPEHVLSSYADAWMTARNVERLIRRGRLADAVALRDGLATSRSGLSTVPPLTANALHHSAALIALAEDRIDDTAAEADAALETAHANGLLLRAVLAIELVAECAWKRGNAATAARLFGAATAERDRIGFVARWTLHPELHEAVIAECKVDHADAFAEGLALDFDAAVEFARRARGERGRPTVGWGSLTPTEQKVAELVAEGLTNEQIARRLLMSPATVKTHLTRIFAKAGVANRTELAVRWPGSNTAGDTGS